MQETVPVRSRLTIIAFKETQKQPSRSFLGFSAFSSDITLANQGSKYWENRTGKIVELIMKIDAANANC